jgi:putative endonuclease
MPCYVYILGSVDGDKCRTYVGWTIDLDRRLEQHNKGIGAKSTRGRRWILLYAERHETRREAMRREWQVKHDTKLRRMVGRLQSRD